MHSKIRCDQSNCQYIVRYPMPLRIFLELSLLSITTMSPSVLFLIFFTNFRNGNSQQIINCRSTAQCRRSYLVCKDNEDCSIDCLGDISCQSSIIMCPLNAQCNINCSNDKSCNNAQIRAEDSTLLNLQCDDYPESCLNLQIYCPHSLDESQANVSKMCHISGINGMCYK